jgi:hypothetical protein
MKAIKQIGLILFRHGVFGRAILVLQNYLHMEDYVFTMQPFLDLWLKRHLTAESYLQEIFSEITIDMNQNSLVVLLRNEVLRSYFAENRIYGIDGAFLHIISEKFNAKLVVHLAENDIFSTKSLVHFIMVRINMKHYNKRQILSEYSKMCAFLPAPINVVKIKTVMSIPYDLFKVLLALCAIVLLLDFYLGPFLQGSLTFYVLFGFEPYPVRNLRRHGRFIIEMFAFMFAFTMGFVLPEIITQNSVNIYETPYRTLEEVNHSGLTIKPPDELSFAFEMSDDKLKIKHFIYDKTDKENIFTYPKYGYMLLCETANFIEKLAENYDASTGRNIYYVLDYSEHYQAEVYLSAKLSPLRDKLEQYMRYLFESGIANYVKRPIERMYWTANQDHQLMTKEELAKGVTLENCQYAFAYLLGGYLLAAIVLVLEILYKKIETKMHQRFGRGRD